MSKAFGWFFVFVLGPLVALYQEPGEETPTLAPPSSVVSARARYDATLADAAAAFDKAAAQAHADYLADLELALRAETMAGNLDGAVAVRDEKTRAAAEGPAKLGGDADQTADRAARIAPFVGTWQVRYTSGSIHTYRVSRGGLVQRIDNKRVSDRSSKIELRDGLVIVTVETPRVEHWTLADNRLVVEHFDPGVPQDGFPQFIGLGSKQQ